MSTPATVQPTSVRICHWAWHRVLGAQLALWIAGGDRRTGRARSSRMSIRRSLWWGLICVLASLLNGFEYILSTSSDESACGRPRMVCILLLCTRPGLCGGDAV
jgi:hypothetical protein